MGIGPFESFSFPNVYTETLNEPVRVTAAGALRFAAFVGVADEATRINNLEMIRGSSSMADNRIEAEDVSSQITGTNRSFTTTYYPLVKGDGNGTVTTDPNSVTVYINGNPVPVSSVVGTTGVIYLVNIPALTDRVEISYYFKRADTLNTDEVLTDQVDGTRTTFRVHYVPIVDGSNGGITTTDVTRITAKVNGTAVTVSSLDGDAGTFVLAAAPDIGDTLTCTYYSNEWQDMSDIIPAKNVSDVVKVGYGPGTSDFTEGTDFVLDTSGAFSTIQWGASYKVVSGQHTIAAEYFDDTQITPTLYDNRIYRRETTGTADSTNKIFTIEYTPCDGAGRAISSDNPDHVVAYHGTKATDATAIDVVQLDSGSRTVLLVSAPPADSTVYVTQYHNILRDDTWTYTDTTTGAVGVGTYTLAGTDSGTAMVVALSSGNSVVADPDFGGGTGVAYPDGTGNLFSDAQVMPGYAVQELVTLTFINGYSFGVTSSVSGGTGSAGDNTGYLNQTYVDAKTGFRITITNGGIVTYQAGDYIGYRVTREFITSATKTRAVPGVKVSVANTTGITVGDTGVLTTYNKSGAEPDIGDFYYVTFDQTKEFDSDGLGVATLYTSEKLALALTGEPSSTNKLAMAAHLAFLNGAPALALLQIQKTTGSDDAPDSRYIKGIDYFNEPMSGGDRPSLMEPVTTSSSVISYLKTSNTIQSAIRYANERMSYFGFAVNTSPTTAQTTARALNSERMIGIYPDGGITTVTDELGNDIEYLVDGSLLAAAICGRDTSPAYDVATPLTRKPVVGFKRLYRRLDSVTAAQTANSGITLLEEQAANIIIKFGLTTDVTSVLTRTPSVIRIKDFIQKGSRSVLQPYIGQKFLVQKTSEIEQTLKSYLASAKKSEIITAFTGVRAVPDTSDPTIIRVTASYSPVLPILWIVITFNLRSSL